MSFKKTILCSFTILLPFLSVGQLNKIQEKMYLLLASSEDHITFRGSEALNISPTDTTRPSILYMFTGETLKTIDTINYDHRIGSIMPECRHFEEFKFFYIRENGIYGEWLNDKTGTYYMKTPDGSNFISILDYSGDSIVIRKACADSISLTCNLLSGLTYYRNGQLFLSFSKCPNHISYSRNLINKNLQISELDQDLFINNQYLRTEPTNFYRMSSGAGFPFNSKGKLVLEFDSRIPKDEWREVYFQFPYEINIKKYFSVNYLLKTPVCSKEVLYKRLTSGATDSITAYYIYDINTTHLDSITTHFKILGMNLYQDRFGYGTLALNPKYSKNKSDDMPPVKRYSDKYGYIPNLQYNTGKFFVWDLERNEFTIFSFDDLDTELLSIHDDWVYFRVFDEIRRIQLVDLYLIGYQKNTELLYKDKDRVPHIHHVFWAPEMPLKVEWKTGNPYAKTSKK